MAKKGLEVSIKHIHHQMVWDSEECADLIGLSGDGVDTERCRRLHSLEHSEMR